MRAAILLSTCLACVGTMVGGDVEHAGETITVITDGGLLTMVSEPVTEHRIASDDIFGEFTPGERRSAEYPDCFSYLDVLDTRGQWQRVRGSISRLPDAWAGTDFKVEDVANWASESVHFCRDAIHLPDHLYPGTYRVVRRQTGAGSDATETQAIFEVLDPSRKTEHAALDWLSRYGPLNCDSQLVYYTEKEILGNLAAEPLTLVLDGDFPNEIRSDALSELFNRDRLTPRLLEEVAMLNHGQLIDALRANPVSVPVLRALHGRLFDEHLDSGHAFDHEAFWPSGALNKIAAYVADAKVQPEVLQNVLGSIATMEHDLNDSSELVAALTRKCSEPAWVDTSACTAIRAILAGEPRTITRSVRILAGAPGIGGFYLIDRDCRDFQEEGSDLAEALYKETRIAPISTREETDDAVQAAFVEYEDLIRSDD